VIKVTAVQSLDGYSLRLTFSDGAAGDLDFTSELWGEMFAPLRDERLFRQVRLDDDLGTIAWPNGADFDPESLRAAIEVVAAPA